MARERSARALDGGTRDSRRSESRTSPAWFPARTGRGRGKRAGTLPCDADVLARRRRRRRRCRRCRRPRRRRRPKCRPPPSWSTRARGRAAAACRTLASVRDEVVHLRERPREVGASSPAVRAKHSFRSRSLRPLTVPSNGRRRRDLSQVRSRRTARASAHERRWGWRGGSTCMLSSRASRARFPTLSGRSDTTIVASGRGAPDARVEADCRAVDVSARDFMAFLARRAVAAAHGSA